MSQPIVFISHHRVKEGKLEGLKQLFRDATKSLEAEKRRTVVFLAYLSEDGAEVTIVHVFPDAEAMDLHFAGADERAAAAYEFVDPQAFEIYGAPSHGVVETMREETASGPRLSMSPQHVGGFIRHQVEAAAKQ
jgi:quinol monooxygenase YgiN